MRKNPFNPKKDKMHVKDCFDHFIDKSIYYIKLHNDNIKNNETNESNDSNELNGNRLQVTDKNGVQHNFYIYNPNLISLQVRP